MKWQQVGGCETGADCTCNAHAGGNQDGSGVRLGEQQQEQKEKQKSFTKETHNLEPGQTQAQP